MQNHRKIKNSCRQIASGELLLASYGREEGAAFISFPVSTRLGTWHSKSGRGRNRGRQSGARVRISRCSRHRARYRFRHAKVSNNVLLEFVSAPAPAATAGHGRFCELSLTSRDHGGVEGKSGFSQPTFGANRMLRQIPMQLALNLRIFAVQRFAAQKAPHVVRLTAMRRL